MPRAVLVVLCLLALGSPARSQDVTQRVEKLVGWLADSDDGVRWEGAMLLGELGPAAAPAVPALIEALRDPSLEVRREAASTLGKIGPRAASAVPALGKALDELNLARHAGDALAGIGAPAVSVLSGRVDDPNPFVRLTVVNALGRIGDTSTIPALVEALDDPNQAIRDTTMGILAELGAIAAPEAVPGLIKALDDPDEELRGLAAYALGEVGDSDAVPALIEALEDRCKVVRCDAARALGMFGPAAAPAVPALIHALDDDDRDAPAHEPAPLPLAGAEEGSVRRAAEASLWEIGHQLKAQGRVLWWGPPLAYWKSIVTLLLYLVVWFGLATRLARRRAGRGTRALYFLLIGGVPTLLVCSGVLYVVTRPWAEGYLPDPVLTVLPFPAAAALSAGFVCVLAAVGVWWRAAPEEPS